MKSTLNDEELIHYGVPGMKWKKGRKPVTINTKHNTKTSLSNKNKSEKIKKVYKKTNKMPIKSTNKLAKIGKFALANALAMQSNYKSQQAVENFMNGGYLMGAANTVTALDYRKKINDLYR